MLFAIHNSAQLGSAQLGSAQLSSAQLLLTAQNMPGLLPEPCNLQSLHSRFRVDEPGEGSVVPTAAAAAAAANVYRCRLPHCLPPSYRGNAVRFVYQVVVQGKLIPQQSGQ
jgi:hypothetical protein